MAIWSRKHRWKVKRSVRERFISYLFQNPISHGSQSRRDRQRDELGDQNRRDRPFASLTGDRTDTEQRATTNVRRRDRQAESAGSNYD